MEEGPKFRGEISLGNTVVRLKRRRAEEVHRKKNYCTGSSSRPLSSSFLPLHLPLFVTPSSLPPEHATCCRECRLAPLEASRTLVAVLVFPFSRQPGDEDEDEYDDATTSFSVVCLEKPLLRERTTGMGYVSGEQDWLL